MIDVLPKPWLNADDLKIAEVAQREYIFANDLENMTGEEMTDALMLVDRATLDVLYKRLTNIIEQHGDNH